MTSLMEPPPLDTRKIDPLPPPGRSANKIVSPTHDAVAPSAATSQIDSGLAPLSIFVFHSFPFALNASHVPSDDQNGEEAPSEPSISRTSTESRRLTYSERFRARQATTARVSPLGEIANG